MPRIIVATLLATSLCGCGQKGPLFLPDAHTREPVSRPASTPAPQTSASPASGADTGGAAAPAASAADQSADAARKKKPQ